MLDQREEDYHHQPSTPSDHLQAPLNEKEKSQKGHSLLKVHGFHLFPLDLMVLVDNLHPCSLGLIVLLILFLFANMC